MNFFKGLGEKLETGFEIAQNQGRQFINKVQGVEATKDERFDESKKLFDHHLETVEKMLQSVKMQDNGLQALGNGLAMMSKHIVSFNGDDNKVPGAGM
jgi:Ran GTPase-activating protein (RanGAP) involved in mRNA processing and transport